MLQDPAVVGLGRRPLAQGLFGGAAVEVGIGVVRGQLHRANLIGNRRLGIAQGQLHDAAVAPGRRIAWGLFQHLVPQGQGLGEIAVAAGVERLVKQLGHCQLGYPHWSQR